MLWCPQKGTKHSNFYKRRLIILVMKFRSLVLAAGVLLTSSCNSIESSRGKTPSVEDYCFSPSSLSVGIERTSTVPHAYMRHHEDVEAVINSMYYGTDGKPMGIAYANAVNSPSLLCCFPAITKA